MTAVAEKSEVSASTTFAEDCKLYIQLHAKHARLEARMKVLKERIKPQLKAGKPSPRSLPYVLVLRSKIRTLYDRKNALADQLKYWLTPEETTKRMELIEANFP